jgi:hypothetical protein
MTDYETLNSQGHLSEFPGIGHIMPAIGTQVFMHRRQEVYRPPVTIKCTLQSIDRHTDTSLKITLRRDDNGRLERLLCFPMRSHRLSAPNQDIRYMWQNSSFGSKVILKVSNVVVIDDDEEEEKNDEEEMLPPSAISEPPRDGGTKRRHRSKSKKNKKKRKRPKQKTRRTKRHPFH